MEPQLAMESLADLHAMSHEPGPMSAGPHLRGSGGHRGPHLAAHPARPLGLAALLDGADFHHAHPHRNPAEHPLSGPLPPQLSMACETPPGMSLSGTYATLTPLQPISAVSDKFPHPHQPHAPPQRLAGQGGGGGGGGGFALMRGDERALATSMSNLYPPYPKEVAGMGQSLSPLSGPGLGGLHHAQQQQGLPHYAHPGPAVPAEKMLTPSGFEAHHPALLARHADPPLAPLPSAGMGPLAGIPHHPQAPFSAPGPGPLRSAAGQPGAPAAQTGGGPPGEEINTREVAQRISTELKRYSIPQAIFAQRVLCRSQGTLSDLLRNPKPWSKLKSGRETFRRMWKWLQEPEFQRMSALRLAACKRKEQEYGKDRGNTPKKPRLVFTDVQRRTLHAIFKENKRPSKELQITISQQLGLELSTVSNFFMNARRRSLDKWQDEGNSSSSNLSLRRASSPPAPSSLRPTLRSRALLCRLPAGWVGAAGFAPPGGCSAQLPDPPPHPPPPRRLLRAASPPPRLPFRAAGSPPRPGLPLQPLQPWRASRPRRGSLGSGLRLLQASLGGIFSTFPPNTDRLRSSKIMRTCQSSAVESKSTVSILDDIGSMFDDLADQLDAIRAHRNLFTYDITQTPETSLAGIAVVQHGYSAYNVDVGWCEGTSHGRLLERGNGSGAELASQDWTFSWPAATLAVDPQQGPPEKRRGSRVEPPATEAVRREEMLSYSDVTRCPAASLPAATPRGLSAHAPSSALSPGVGRGVCAGAARHGRAGGGGGGTCSGEADSAAPP
uniref:hepatocyte nuclear factor 6 n=1 Tax=Euleptes europaea TaxID=460621 RepID=UPI0025411702